MKIPCLFINMFDLLFLIFIVNADDAYEVVLILSSPLESENLECKVFFFSFREKKGLLGSIKNRFISKIYLIFSFIPNVG